MGIKGTVRRAVDTNFIHSNIDADVVVGEEPEVFGSTAKPAELYEIVEHFCMGRRRLELFGSDRTLREGWVTVGEDITKSTWDRAKYNAWFDGTDVWPKVRNHCGGRLLGSEDVIEELRPKSVERERDMQRALKESENVDPEKLQKSLAGILKAGVPVSASDMGKKESKEGGSADFVHMGEADSDEEEEAERKRGIFRKKR